MGKMIVLPGIKKIAEMNAKIMHLAKILNEKMDTEGLNWERAYLIANCEERNGHLYCGNSQLDNEGIVDDLYYCEQYDGYTGDDFHGTLYFKTNVPGQFVAVPFEM